MPPQKEYQAYLDKIWKSHWLTNNGPLLKELEQKLKSYTGIENFLYVSNGTIAIQLALKALDLTGEIITTPYSYCATTTAILWENCKPVFVDINEHDLNIDASLIEAKITPETTAILATHVYGNPCEVEKIEEIAKKYHLAVIYDAAHAFGVNLNGISLLAYGDVSTCSFHATKVFHTVEGGSVVTKDKALLEKIALYRSFGHINDDYYSMGINGKNSEFHAAMGLANLPHLAKIIADREEIAKIYDKNLDFSRLQKPYSKAENLVYNFAYYPLVFQSAEKTDAIIKALNEADIFPRRYFYPSLNTLSYVNSSDSCPISESVVNRVLALPYFPDLELDIQHKIIEIVNQNS